MTQALSISSQVAYGPVGNSAAVPALEWLGVTVHALPTVVLSNHPGHGRPAGLRVPARDLAAMADALEALGVARRLPRRDDRLLRRQRADPLHRAHGAQISRAGTLRCCICAIRCSAMTRPGFTCPSPWQHAIRDELLPLADAIAPNRFELEWLSGQPIGGQG